MSYGALSGFTIAITADRRSEEQAELITRRGGAVLSGAVIRTLPLSDEPALRSATSLLIARPPDVAVLCTSLGVRGWFSAAEGLGLDDGLSDALRSARVIARGPKAAGAALAVGVAVDWMTPGATYSEVIDHLASLPTRHQDGTPVRVAVQLDGQDSSGMGESLQALGYDVVAVRVYRWTMPTDVGPAERIASAVGDGLVDAVTFTSAHAVANFVAIARQAGTWDRVLERVNRDVSVCCVGPVTAAAARSAGVHDPLEPTLPRLGAMVQVLARAFAERSVTLHLNDVAVHVQGRLVVIGDGEPVRLADRERAVFDALAHQPGAVLSKRALAERVWAGAVDDHVVEVTIGRLRKRLGPAGASIGTVMRRGYRLDLTGGVGTRASIVAGP